MIPELRIDPEFQKVIPPLDKDELATLTETILKDGEIYFPIFVWEGAIIDGHHRYEILKAHPELIFRIKDISFDNKYEAIAWICKNQLGRRNLTEKQKAILIGRRYKAEKRAHGAKNSFRGNQFRKVVTPHSEELPKSTKVTAELIGKESGVSAASVERAAEFVSGLDAIDAISPEICDDIVSERLNATQKQVIAIGHAPPEDRPQMVADLRKPKESSTGKKGNAIACTPSGRPTSEERKDIRRIVAELVAEKDPVGEDEILVTMDSAFCTMMETCDQLFSQFPGLRTEPKYRNKVIKIIQKPKQYLLKIESEMQ